MFFKSLEIQGFKSFADKTVLNFDTRTTAVVGSNGNGKQGDGGGKGQNDAQDPCRTVFSAVGVAFCLGEILFIDPAKDFKHLFSFHTDSPFIDGGTFQGGFSGAFSYGTAEPTRRGRICLPFC